MKQKAHMRGDGLRTMEDAPWQQKGGQSHKKKESEFSESVHKTG